VYDNRFNSRIVGHTIASFGGIIHWDAGELVPNCFAASPRSASTLSLLFVSLTAPTRRVRLGSFGSVWAEERDEMRVRAHVSLRCRSRAQGPETGVPSPHFSHPDDDVAHALVRNAT
jgi:hypothetical protein